MTQTRAWGMCAKINDNEVLALVGGHDEAEIYDINLNKWTVRSEYRLPHHRHYPRMDSINGRIFVMGGGHSGGDVDSVLEWKGPVLGWVEKKLKMPTPHNDWNGGIVPFVMKYKKT